MAFLAAIPAWAYLATSMAGTAMSIAGAATRNPGLQAGGGALSMFGSLGGGALGSAGSAGGAAGSGLMSALSLGGQLATGILGNTQAANQANAQADMLEQQAKFAEQRQIQRDQALISKQHANAAASGVMASSGSPFAVTIDSTRDLQTNAADIRRAGELQAYSRRLQAQGYYNRIPGLIDNGLLKLAPTVLSSFMSR